MIHERLRIFPILLLLWTIILAQGVCGAEIVSPASPMITDVTPVSFSVVWTTSEPAICGMNIFVDAEGTTPYTEAEVLSESSRHPPAEDIGVMKVRVLGLKPGSQYFFQTKTTYKRNGTVSLYPEGPPFIEVKTEASSIVVLNDILAQQINVGGGRLTLGTILTAHLDSASYPISGWVGEGVPDNWAAIDANNFYDKETRLNLELEGGEVLKLTVLGGGTCYVETQDTVPEENGGIQSLEVGATLPDSMCKNLRQNLVPVIYIPLLVLDND